MNILGLDYVVAETTTPDRWRELAEDVLGLAKANSHARAGWQHYKMDDRVFRLAVQEGLKDRYVLAGWDVGDETALTAYAERLRQAGIAVERGSPSECAERCVLGLIRFSDADGNAHELVHGGHRDYQWAAHPGGPAHFVTDPMGMGHVVLRVSDLDRAFAFYRDVLGFGLSDHLFLPVGEDKQQTIEVRFLHAANARHHSLGLAAIPTDSNLIHMMIEVPDIDDVGRALDRTTARGFPIVETLGRHANDHMLSFYLGTPSGFDLEYGCQGRRVDWTNTPSTVSTVGDLWGHVYLPPLPAD
jgi:3,4-dihydroxy-9,10-secoandrosta-1,3,5(10)-triene-9,17-dione 4,5-dioxygenase